MNKMNVEIDLPQFSSIVLSDVEESLDQLLSKSRVKIEQLVVSGKNYTWQTLMQPLEDINDQLHCYWAPISHLNAVVNSPLLREVYHACLPKLSKYTTEISHHYGLYQAIQSLADGIEYQKLNKAQRKVVDNEIHNFKLAGISLPPEKKQRFAELAETLSQLQNKFEENLLDATQGWFKQVTDENELRGLPPHAITLAHQTAAQRELEGWIFTLEIPSYLAVMTYANSRALRQEMLTAFVTRASDQGPNAGKWDNTQVIEKILNARLELAQLLDFSNFAQYSLETKMVKEPQKVLEFLNQLLKASLPKAKEEFKELCEFSRKNLGIKKLESWDIAYTAEKLCQQRYAISQEDLRPYFPEAQVVQGLFNVVNRLFQISVRLMVDVDIWHPDVRCYAVYDAQDQLRGYFYFDLYARENKRGGAWMDDPRLRRRLSNTEVQLPVAFVNCNFNPPVANHPALFSHDEVVTLFHEFGHAIQHMLTKIDYAEVSGIHGIPWDAVELASQFLENWAWQKESLLMLAKHYQTGEPLPDELFQRMHKARNFQAAMQMIRQLEFALFDMRLHMEFDLSIKNQVQKLLDEVRQEVCVVPIAAFNRFQNSFSHIFSGSYAAGYYSYKWAEVMAADAFSLFQEKGIFNSHSAQQFLTYILEPGGSEEPMHLFKAFRGREPKIEALLHQKGIKPA
ncbi:M3 family metallopeptidase [Candidatus Coxiella mudrowiae]|uniref:M3 family metallopeptidase n=1 Tax=Candidatus Coxiella mudrowiae TaxID=2054173 RepID=UPI000C28A144|nr:M3 family metallopeptidase [Candidatus Coxiella mudrowiae]